MEYTQVDTGLTYDLLAKKIYDREMEYLDYDLIIKSMNQLLTTELTDEQRATAEQVRDSHQVQADMVQQYHNALVTQINDQTAYQAAIARAAAARSA